LELVRENNLYSPDLLKLPNYNIIVGNAAAMNLQLQSGWVFKEETFQNCGELIFGFDVEIVISSFSDYNAQCFAIQHSDAICQSACLWVIGIVEKRILPIGIHPITVMYLIQRNPSFEQQLKCAIQQHGVSGISGFVVVAVMFICFLLVCFFVFF
jgi:hypothetical protein